MEFTLDYEFCWITHRQKCIEKTLEEKQRKIEQEISEAEKRKSKKKKGPSKREL